MPEIEGAENFSGVSPAPDTTTEQPTDTASAPGIGTQESDTAATSGQEATAGQSDAEQDDLTALPDDAPDWARTRVSQIAEQRRQAREEAQQSREEAQQYRDRLEAIEPLMPLIEDLKAQGYTSAEAIQETLARQQQEYEWQAQQAEQSRAAEAEINGWAADGKIDPELAPVLKNLVERLQQLEPMAQRIEQQEQQQQYQRQVDAAVTTLKTQYPDMDERTVRLAIRAGEDPTAEARRTHESGARAVAAYNAQIAKRPKVAPEGGNGQAPGINVGLDPSDPNYRVKWEQQIAEAQERRARYGVPA